MYSWLRGYLYIVLLMIVSSSSFALTPEEQAFQGFAFNTICSHPSDLGFCFKADEGNAQQDACLAWMSYMQSGQTGTNARQYSFDGARNNTCYYNYVVVSTGAKGSNSQALVTRAGQCPTQGAPPPETIIFGRQGRWFPQEVAGKRCYKKCEYSVTTTTFSVKHYVFTNGILSQFTETGERAKSLAKFCFAEPEPIRNDQGEVTEDASCSDNVFKVFCDFVNWYRTDAEMPEAPEVENKTLQIDSYLKNDHVKVNPNGTSEYQCFEPVELKFFIPLTRQETTVSIEFYNLCNILREMSLFFHALYLLHAAFIIFRN